MYVCRYVGRHTHTYIYRYTQHMYIASEGLARGLAVTIPGCRMLQSEMQAKLGCVLWFFHAALLASVDKYRAHDLEIVCLSHTQRLVLLASHACMEA